MSLYRCGVFLLAFLAPCFGRELIYLTSGFTLEVESHTATDQRLLCTTATGTLEFQLSDVARIEVLPSAAPPSAGNSSAVSTATSANDLLAKAAIDQGLPLELVRSVAKIESGFQQDAVSAKGAIGLMQLMPGTAAQLGVRADRAEENAQGGAKYLRDLLLRYHYDSALALAAYNAGAGAVDKYRGVPPYAETRQYVLKVLHEYEREHRLQRGTAVASGSAPADANR
jgi:soluble lytic murein transglycosylase-like protein